MLTVKVTLQNLKYAQIVFQMTAVLNRNIFSECLLLHCVDIKGILFWVPRTGGRTYSQTPVGCGYLPLIASCYLV